MHGHLTRRVIAGFGVGLLLSGCDAATRPAPRLYLQGPLSYAATAVDDQPLPVSLELMVQPAVVTASRLELTGFGIFTWEATGYDPETGEERVGLAIGKYVWVNPDSLEFTSGADGLSQGYVRRRGDELTVIVADAPSNQFGLAFYLGGSHTWTLVRVP